MSSELAAGFEAPPSLVCPRCGESVPAGSFCGACGGHFTPANRASERLRWDAYAAAPSEHLLQLSLVTTLFPHLPHRSHTAFRAGSLTLFVTVVVLGALRLEAPLIAVSAAALPVLFQLYLSEVDLYEEERFARPFAVFAIAAALGVGYALWTGPIVARDIAAPISPLSSAGSLWTAGILIPLGAQLAMLIPGATARMLSLGSGESLDGFAFGAAGALGFVLTDTLTRLWPQLSQGIRPTSRGVADVLAEGVLQGVAVPLVAACGSGLVIAALLTRRRGRRVHAGGAITAPGTALALVALLQAGLGVADLWRPAPLALAALHVAAALVLLMALRIGLHLVLLDELHEFRVGGPFLCPHCRHLVPAMPFCPHCGAATRSSTRKIRSALTLAPLAIPPEKGAER